MQSFACYPRCIPRRSLLSSSFFLTLFPSVLFLFSFAFSPFTPVRNQDFAREMKNNRERDRNSEKTPGEKRQEGGGKETERRKQREREKEEKEKNEREPARQTREGTDM